MAEVTTETALNVIEILKGIKTLLAKSDPYLPVYSALGGAFLGAVATFITVNVTNKVNNPGFSLMNVIPSERSSLNDC